LSEDDGWFTVHEALKLFNEEAFNKESSLNMIYSEISKRLKEFYNVEVKEEDAIHNRNLEYIEVTKQRTESITEILEPSLSKIKSVFGQETYSYKDALRTISTFVHDSTPLVFGHGDCNDSNCLVKINSQYGIDDVKFIDPRGKFGDANLVTDEAYDQGKFVYGITGYSSFNLLKEFKPVIDENGDLTYNSENPLESLDLLDCSDYVKLMVGVCWIKLPAYIINNPAKSIAAFHTGLAILKKYEDKLLAI